MQIPNIPTDNLYKFLALTGLFILFTSIGLYEYRLHIHEVENAKIRVGKEALKSTTENYFQDLEDIVDQMLSEYETLKTNPEPFNKDEAHALVDKYKNEYRQKVSQRNRQGLTDKAMELRLMSELADASVMATNRMTKWLLFSSFVGLVTTIIGFTLWYFKLQRYQDEKLKNEVSNFK